MADRTMKELLQAPTEGYGEAIVIREILAEIFEIKMNFLQLVQANKFHGRENDNPHTHISNFKRMTATLKYGDVSNDAIQLMHFPYFLEDRARICEAWDRFKELLRACPHHGFSELTQIDTFYNGLTEQDQDSLNAAAGGAHAYYECIATDSNPSSICAASGSYNQISPPNRANHQIPQPGTSPQLRVLYRVTLIRNILFRVKHPRVVPPIEAALAFGIRKILALIYDLVSSIILFRVKLPRVVPPIEAALAQNDLFRAENDKIKQHYKELYDSIKITRAKHIKHVTKLTTKDVNLKTCVSKATVNPQVSARDKHVIDVEPIIPRLRNNRDAHLDYLRHLKEMYPSNTPATLVPKVLPTTSQVKIHIFTLIQLFLEFDKTCKKRITPSAITDGEQGFEQTKACYLQEVIPFFQTIKDNFEGIQKALTKEVKQMKDVFEELEAEVSQCAVDRKHDAIDRKNLLIANDNLIVECLSKEVFSVAMKSELNVARFVEMHVANTSVEARYLALEAELATLRDKSHHENQGELIKYYSKLEGKDNVIRQLKKQLFKLQVTNSDTECTVKVRTTDSQLTKDAIDVELMFPRLRNNKDAHLDYLRHLKESVETIRDIVEEAKVVVRPLDRSIVSACRYTKHSQELLEYAIGVNSCPIAGGSQPKSHVKSNRICQQKVVQIVLWYLDSGCSKHITGDRSRLLNFVKKFIGTVRFGNDHFGAIMGYGDYVVGESVISMVYYVEGLGHNLFSIGQFCDSDLEVAFRKHSCYV
uniref:Integrase, catalytic region, zinc finger, CCHC-type, peptidase aspartic, catalytic n=1 Tax=Tanacetum cinerariifolium TaxID=118510 RepID=A0A6L2MA55_TANCI|nr:hypothetical protein [Tanacetum cinerariifolium]